MTKAAASQTLVKEFQSLHQGDIEVIQQSRDSSVVIRIIGRSSQSWGSRIESPLHEAEGDDSAEEITMDSCELFSKFLDRLA